MNHPLRLCLAAALAACALPQFAGAAEILPDTHLIATAGLTHGGDAWVVGKNAAGANVEMTGGGTVELGGGLLWQSPSWPMAASLTANYHFDRAAGINGGSAKFTRVPIEAIAYYTGMSDLRFGAGLSHVASPTIKATTVNGNESIDLNGATGKLVEIGYKVCPNVWLNIRLVSEKFSPKTAGATQSADVSHIGVNVSYVF